MCVLCKRVHACRARMDACHVRYDMHAKRGMRAWRAWYTCMCGVCRWHACLACMHGVSTICAWLLCVRGVQTCLCVPSLSWTSVSLRPSNQHAWHAHTHNLEVFPNFFTFRIFWNAKKMYSFRVTAITQSTTWHNTTRHHSHKTKYTNQKNPKFNDFDDKVMNVKRTRFFTKRK